VSLSVQQSDRSSGVQAVGQPHERIKAHLHLFSDEVLVHRMEGFASKYEPVRMPLLSVSFEYDGMLVPFEDDGAEVGRDQGAERHIGRILEGFGATDLSCVDYLAVSPGTHADYVIACEGSVSDYCAFYAHVVPQLRGMGMNVTVSKDFEFRTTDSEWYARTEPDQEKPDWFNLELGIDIEGSRFSLLPALVELLEQCGSGEGLRDLVRRGSRTIALPTGQNLYVTVPGERLRSILRVIAELHEGNYGSVETLSFPKTRSGALERLELAFNGDESKSGVPAKKLLTWQGTPPPKSRASMPPAQYKAPQGLTATLRPYQEEGVSWLCQLREDGTGGILADDMGLGKTLQTIAYLCKEKDRGGLAIPALIVAPTSLVNNWQRELTKFAPHLKHVAIQGKERAKAYAEIARVDVVITTYPVVCRDEDLFQEHAFSSLILDEAQTVKNEKSQAHRVVRNLSSEHRLCLTGTPVENHLGELWAISDFINPGLLGDEMYFTRFFRMPIERERNGERLVALRELLGPYILRRTKAEVAKDLPPKTELFRPVELRGQHRELYETIRVAAHSAVRKLIKTKGLAASTVPILGALTKLRQVCCDPRLAGFERNEKASKSSKLNFFEELLTERLQAGSRILVFSQFTSMLKLIADRLDERGVKYTALTGATEDRGKVVDEFESGSVAVFLISLRAGGTGLTLTSADTVIHYDPWWNPAVQAQATDRAYRIGQKKPVFVHHLYVAGSVEERMLRLQKRKRQVSDAILGEGAAMSALTEEDVEILFAPLGA
jgi:superfamily II DNA or RNA helicase